MGLLNKSEDKIYTGSLLSKLILDITIYNYIKDGKVVTTALVHSIILSLFLDLSKN
jgi:hypothetical protein